MDEENRTIREMKGEKKKTIKGEEWAEEQGLILFQGKVYVPLDIELWKEIVHLHHNIGTSRQMEDSRVGDEELLVARNF